MSDLDLDELDRRMEKVGAWCAGAQVAVSAAELSGPSVRPMMAVVAMNEDGSGQITATFDCVLMLADLDAIRNAYPALSARLRELESRTEPDITTCPQCGGEADNGFDRGLPPSPYYCTRCTDTESLRAELEAVKRERDEWRENRENNFQCACPDCSEAVWLSGQCDKCGWEP